MLLSTMDREPDAMGLSQRGAYDRVFNALRHALAQALQKGSKRLLATYLQTLLAYPDGCTRGETVFDPATGIPIVQVPPLSEEKLYPKEQALVDLVAAERLEGRKVLVYATHTGTRDITGRMDDILTRHGFRVAVMKADAVAPDRREAWVADRVKEGVDMLICHPPAGADGVGPDRLPDHRLVRDRVLCLPIDRKMCGSRGQSIWMQLGVNKCQRAAEATDLPSLVNPRAGLPTTSGLESSHVTGAELVLEVEGDMEAGGDHLANGVRCDGRLAPVEGAVGPGRWHRPQKLAARRGPGLSLKLREEPCDAVCVLRLSRPRVDAVAP